MISILTTTADFSSAQAQILDIQMPTDVSQCVPVTIEWSGGMEPYTLIASPLPLTPLDIPQTYANLSGNAFVWTPKFYVALSLAILTLNDSTGAVAQTDAFLIGGSDDRSCLGNQSTSSSSSSSSGATSTAGEGDSVDSPPTDASSQDLSSGAIAGIVVGTLAVVAFFALSAMWIRKKRVQAFRRRHRATRSEWQALADMPGKGDYAFSGGTAQLKNHTDMPVPPSPALKRPSEVGGGFAPRRATTTQLAEEPRTGPLNVLQHDF